MERCKNRPLSSHINVVLITHCISFNSRGTSPSLIPRSSDRKRKTRDLPGSPKWCAYNHPDVPGVSRTESRTYEGKSKRKTKSKQTLGITRYYHECSHSGRSSRTRIPDVPRVRVPPKTRLTEQSGFPTELLAASAAACTRFACPATTMIH